jgi:hypothetical protein
LNCKEEMSTTERSVSLNNHALRDDAQSAKFKTQLELVTVSQVYNNMNKTHNLKKAFHQYKDGEEGKATNELKSQELLVYNAEQEFEHAKEMYEDAKEEEVKAKRHSLCTIS